MRLRYVLAVLAAALPAAADDGGRLLRLDHYVQVHSAVPAIAGQNTQIYVREVVEAATVLRGGPAPDRVALFIHGAGTPAEVSFDVPYQDYSWMAYLAHAGFDVFSMDMTGYGRSTRPAAMNDPCNLTRAAAGGLRAGADPRALRRQLSASDDHARFGLARYRRGRRSRARAAPRGQAESAGVVAGRPAFGRIRGAACR